MLSSSLAVARRRALPDKQALVNPNRDAALGALAFPIHLPIRRVTGRPAQQRKPSLPPVRMIAICSAEVPLPVLRRGCLPWATEPDCNPRELPLATGAAFARGRPDCHCARDICQFPETRFTASADMTLGIWALRLPTRVPTRDAARPEAPVNSECPKPGKTELPLTITQHGSTFGFAPVAPADALTSHGRDACRAAT